MTDLAERLRHFRQTVQPSQFEGWTYYKLGNPQAEALLFLHGGGADAEAMFPYLQKLSALFYVIAPNLPPKIRKLDKLTQGLEALIQHEQIQRFHLVGLAFGGLVAQVFLRKVLGRVGHVVLSHSMIPSAHLLDYAKMQAFLLAIQPSPFLRKAMQRTYQHALAQSLCPVDDSIRQFWQGYFQDAYQTRITKQMLHSRARLTADYHQSPPFSTKDLADWTGKILLIESAEDEQISEGDRGAFQAMYPRAYLQRLENCDHLAPLLVADELAESIFNFLEMSGREK